ncbi:MAG: hypothetical protein ACTSV1_05885 [Alphaproteobacteria bacterium]
MLKKSYNGSRQSIVWLCLVLVLSVGFASAPSQATEDVWIINPFEKDSLPIPDNSGMEHFYGEWWPGGQADADIFRWMRIHRDGRLTYDYYVKPDDPRITTEHFKVLAFDSKMVLLINRFWDDYPPPPRYVYFFWVLILREDRFDGQPRMVQNLCRYPRMTDDLWAGPTQGILELFKTSKHCNPRLTSTAKYPWERWSYGRFFLNRRFE